MTEFKTTAKMADNDDTWIAPNSHVHQFFELKKISKHLCKDCYWTKRENGFIPVPPCSNYGVRVICALCELTKDLYEH